MAVGKRDDGYAVAFESFAFHKTGYEDVCELGPGEIVELTPDRMVRLEYQEDGIFEDRGTTLARNRMFPEVEVPQRRGAQHPKEERRRRRRGPPGPPQGSARRYRPLHLSAAVP